MKKNSLFILSIIFLISLSFLTACKDDKEDPENIFTFHELVYSADTHEYKWIEWKECKTPIINNRILKVEGGTPPYFYFSMDNYTLAGEEYYVEYETSPFYGLENLLMIYGKQIGTGIIEISDKNGNRGKLEVLLEPRIDKYKIEDHFLSLDIEDFEMEEGSFVTYLKNLLTERLLSKETFIDMKSNNRTSGEFTIYKEEKSLYEGTFEEIQVETTDGWRFGYLLKSGDQQSQLLFDHSYDPENTYHRTFVEDLTEEFKKKYPTAGIHKIHLVSYWNWI